MGIYDRDYLRDEPRGIFLGGQQSVVVNLILINAGVFLVNWFSADQINEYLALYANLFPTGAATDAWRLLGFVTHGFAHAGLWHLLGNMLVLWFFGRDVEAIYGPKLFLRVYMSLLVLAGLCWWLALNLTYGSLPPFVRAVGASGAIAGIFFIFVCHFPTRVVYFWGVVPIPAWALGTLWIAYDLFGDRAGIAWQAHLGGALFGFIFYQWRITLFSWFPNVQLKNPFKNLRRPRLRLHEPEEEDDWDLEERVDRILAKISAQGTDSLTPEEQRILEAASRRAQRRRNLLNN